MPTYTTEAIRAIALVGHAGAGKTSLAEALLFKAGAISSQGSVERGNTVCDFDPLEKSSGHSITASLVNFAYEGVHIHLIDTPGYPDLVGQSISALAAVETAAVVIDAQAGIQLTTGRMMRQAAARGLARMIIVNKIDAENVDLPALVADIREKFGKQCLLLDLPAHDRSEVVEVLEHDAGDADFESVAAAHRALIDTLVEEDETLLARYLEEGTDPAPDELHAPFEKALREGHLVPILFISARTGAGIDVLLHVFAALAPNPAEGNPPPFYKGEPGDDKAVAFHAEPDGDKHVLAHVFKVVMDPYVGKVGVFRVYQGTLTKDSQLFVGDGRRPFKVGHLYVLQGKDFVETDALVPGDIGAVAKVDEIEFNSVLHDSHDEDHIHLIPLEFPKPMHGLAVETTRKGDEQRIFEVLHKLEIEDPCFRVERHPTTNETVIRGLGELHLRGKLEKMASQYKLEVTTQPPKVPYRETITRFAEGHHRHKKQTGGAGQFGEVYLKVEPRERGEGFEFLDQTKGGVIPGVFMPAVEKGVLQALAEGCIAGYPIDDLRVIVYDGKSHPVDGKEVAFISAGKKAVLDAIAKAGPVVLEPIVDVEITAPEKYVGDLTSDLSSRRGQVTGTEPRGTESMTITGQVPLSELTDYQSRLRSMTGGYGAYTLEYSHYAAVPPHVQQQLTSQYKRAADED